MNKKEKNLKFIYGRWFIDFTFRHKRIRRFAGYTKEQAKNVLAKMRLELLNESMGFKRLSSERLPFDKFASEFLEIYSKQNKRSWARDELSIRNLKRFFGNKAIQDIGPEDVERFKAARKAEGVSPATVNRELACLKTIFNKAVEWGKLEHNPAAKVKKFKESNGKERYLTEGEARQLLEAASPGLKPILIVALSTGMRKEEILGLRWENIRFDKSYIHLEDSKSGKSRDIPMNIQVYETLKALPRYGEYVFYNPSTKDRIKDIKRAFQTACKRAGIKGLRFHDLRHTASSWMVEAGVDLVTISKILGHSSIQMTMRYAHPTPENMRLAVQKLGQKLEKASQETDIIETKPFISLLNKDN